MAVQDQMSGGHEVAAGSGPLLQIVAGWVLGFGLGHPREELDAGALESKPQEIHTLIGNEIEIHPQNSDRMMAVNIIIHAAIYLHAGLLARK